MVTINAQTQDWWSALRVYVPTKSSCSYNLWNYYYNQDVFYVRGDGYTWAWKGHLTGSDVSFKRNITPIESALSKVKSLQGVRCQYKNGEDDFHFGFIAQDVEKICPEVVKDMPEGIKAISYSELIAVLVEVFKEQQTQIENLQMMVSACCQQNTDYSPSKNQNESDRPDDREKINENTLKHVSADENSMQGIEKAKLFQNVPNPFSMNSEILFEIPEYATSAKLLIHDMQGAEIKSCNIMERGVGKLVIQGSELQAGMYMYTLLVDNVIIDTKKMILTK